MYCEEETLRIDLAKSRSFDLFTDLTLKKRLKLLIIKETFYHNYQTYGCKRSCITIPDTIVNLSGLECICIRARVTTLPNSLSRLKKLMMLDLSGCYNILSIPSQVLGMRNLKIKIDDIICPASEVVIIRVPSKRISADLFSVLSGRNIRRLHSLLFIKKHQILNLPNKLLSLMISAERPEFEVSI